ncbi:MAG: HIT domain-containing protein [Candidatus Dojkabacteria bacterium]|nr:HIT domain-containing protein [Candidatus Dojkabacteria bacterium]
MSSNQCIFCKIVSGEIPSHVVFENDFVKAFLDIFPKTRGHVLVIPKKHYSDFIECDDQIYIEVMKVVKSISKVLKKVFACNRVVVMIEGYLVDHLHVHLIPTMNPSYAKRKQTKASDEELRAVCEMIKSNL